MANYTCKIPFNRKHPSVLHDVSRELPFSPATTTTSFLEAIQYYTHRSWNLITPVIFICLLFFTNDILFPPVNLFIENSLFTNHCFYPLDIDREREKRSERDVEKRNEGKIIISPFFSYNFYFLLFHLSLLSFSPVSQSLLP